MNFLTISNLYKSYDQTDILKGINLNIKKGEFWVLLGPSGCGKTTLLNTIAGLTEHNSGDIFIDGKNVNKLRPSERDIAMVFQSYALYPTMNVEQNMRFGLEMRKTPKDIIQEKISTVANTLQIKNLLARKPAQLSGGQRQRVAMGRAIVRDPKIFLFDEPLSNLDAKLRVDMRTEIHNLHNRLKATIVYVTHDQTEAMTLADQIALFSNGQIVQAGPPREMYFNPVNKFTASFIGSPSINFIEGSIETKDDQLYFKMLHDNREEWLLINNPAQQLSSYVSKKVTLGLRPEWIRFAKSSEEIKQYKMEPISVKLDFSELAGAETFIFFNLAGSQVLCCTDSIYTTKYERQGDYHIGIDTEHAIFFDPETEKNIGKL